LQTVKGQPTVDGLTRHSVPHVAQWPQWIPATLDLDVFGEITFVEMIHAVLTQSFLSVNPLMNVAGMILKKHVLLAVSTP
jgi:hypothetical protein